MRGLHVVTVPFVIGEYKYKWTHVSCSTSSGFSVFPVTHTVINPSTKRHTSAGLGFSCAILHCGIPYRASCRTRFLLMFASGFFPLKLGINWLSSFNVNTYDISSTYMLTKGIACEKTSLGIPENRSLLKAKVSRLVYRVLFWVDWQDLYNHSTSIDIYTYRDRYQWPMIQQPSQVPIQLTKIQVGSCSCSYTNVGRMRCSMIPCYFKLGSRQRRCPSK
jgi:hypothetical protein